MDDVRAASANQRQQFDQPENVPARIEGAPHVAQRDELYACCARRIGQRAVAVGRQGRVVALGNGREQRGDVALRAATLGEGDH